MLSSYYDIAEIINLDDSFNPITEAPITINSIKLNKNGKDDKSLTFNINIPESETNNGRIDEYEIAGLNFIVSGVLQSFTNTNGNITADEPIKDNFLKSISCDINLYQTEILIKNTDKLLSTYYRI